MRNRAAESGQTIPVDRCELIDWKLLATMRTCQPDLAVTKIDLNRFTYTESRQRDAPKYSSSESMLANQMIDLCTTSGGTIAKSRRWGQAGYHRQLSTMSCPLAVHSGAIVAEVTLRVTESFGKTRSTSSLGLLSLRHAAAFRVLPEGLACMQACKSLIGYMKTFAYGMP